MSISSQEFESISSNLCKSCGLCCTGHLFSQISLEPIEIETARAVGFDVTQSTPDKSSASQPCPFWKGDCKIYFHPNKPNACGRFKCKLLKELEGGEIELTESMKLVEQAKEKIHELEELMPIEEKVSFLVRFSDQITRMEKSNSSSFESNSFRLKAGVLLVIFKQRFGVSYFTNQTEIK
jgi:hypothetical protein